MPSLSTTHLSALSPHDIALLTTLLSPSTTLIQATHLINGLPFHLLARRPIFPFFLSPNPLPCTLCRIHQPLNPDTILSVYDDILTELGPRTRYLMSCPKELLSEATQTVLAHLERLKTMLRSQRGKGSCVACILALIPTDVPALTALRTTLLSRKQRNRLMPRLLAWVDGWLDTLLGEVRPRSARDARAVMRDRRKLRRARQGVGGDLRKRERQKRKSNGHWKGRRESDDYDDWEGEVVQAYKSPVRTGEREDSTRAQPGTDGFSSDDEADGWESAADPGGGDIDAERRACEYRKLLDPREFSGTPVPDRASARPQRTTRS